MGAGRKTETYTLCHYHQYPGGYYEVPARNLATDKLGAIIFGCTHHTMNECIIKQLFGLPAPHIVYVRNVKPGLPLFLFNYSDRNLYGIFEATSHGQMNIDPNGWTAHGSGRTLYPAQVRVHIRQKCQPLNESQYKPIIAENYFNSQHFMFELDNAQTGKLLALLTPLAIPRGQPTLHKTPRETDVGDLPPWSRIQEVGLCKPPTSEAENPTDVPNLETDFPALPSQNEIEKTVSLEPATSEAENSTSVTTVHLETDFPSLPSRTTMQKKVSFKPSTSAPHNSVQLETALPMEKKAVLCKAITSATSASQSRVEPEFPLCKTAEKNIISCEVSTSTTSTTQYRVTPETNLPPPPSGSTIQDPIWLAALISEAEHSYRSQLFSAPLFGTFQAVSDTKKTEQEDNQLIHVKMNELDLHRDLHSKSQNIPHPHDVIDSRAGSAYTQSDHKNGERSCDSSAECPESTFYLWVINGLLQEVKELKNVRTAQTEKISYLEAKLGQAQYEIQQLKDFIIHRWSSSPHP